MNALEKTLRDKRDPEFTLRLKISELTTENSIMKFNMDVLMKLVEWMYEIIITFGEKCNLQEEIQNNLMTSMNLIVAESGGVDITTTDVSSMKVKPIKHTFTFTKDMLKEGLNRDNIGLILDAIKNSNHFEFA